MAREKSEGRFPAVLVTHDVITSKEKKTPGVEMVFRYEDEDGDEHLINKVVWLSESMLTDHLDNLQKTFSVFGFDIVENGFEFRAWRKPGEDEESEFVGMPASIVIEEREYEKDGQTKVGYEVLWVNDPNGGARTFNESATDDVFDKIKRMATGQAPPTRVKSKSKAMTTKAKAKSKARASTSGKKSAAVEDDDAPPF